MSRAESKFGGDWTLVKLGILESYLDAYTTALKNRPSRHQPFKLVYIDAFAGTGQIDQSLQDDHDSEKSDFILGSAARALKIENPYFDHLLFVESDRNKYNALEQLKMEYPSRSIRIERGDANHHLKRLRRDEYGPLWRGVLFLDPFGTQVNWKTVKHIAQLQRLDTWLLFPIGTLARMLPRNCDPSAVSSSWVNTLNRVYGNDIWRTLYSEPLQTNLFGPSGTERNRGVEGLLKIYKKQLRHVFGVRLLRTSFRLRNSMKSPLYEFIFCAGHPRGVTPAHRIADHLMKMENG